MSGSVLSHLTIRVQQTAVHPSLERKDRQQRAVQFLTGAHRSSRGRPTERTEGQMELSGGTDEGHMEVSGGGDTASAEAPDRVTLHVGGEKFVTCRATLEPASSYFARRFSAEWSSGVPSESCMK